VSETEICSPEEAQRVIRRVFEEIWNQGHVQVAEEVFAKGHVGHAGDGHEMTAESLQKTVLSQRALSPELHYVVNQFIIEGPWIATRWTGTGIGRDDGSTVSRWGITMWHLSGRLIEEAWVLTSDASPVLP
jgi:hypothetical protein